jgi:hypothetical protein
VILAVKNFASIPGVCHIGLGVTATNTLKVLRRNGIHCEAWPAQTYAELRSKLSAETKKADYTPISHLIVSSPAWIQPSQFKTLCLLYPEIQFVLLSHSGTAYLSIDKYGIRNLSAGNDLAREVHNFTLAANNPRSKVAFDAMWGADTVLLPNLYDTSSYVPYTRRQFANHIRVFNPGASRPWKNQLTAAEASIMLARRLGVELKYFVNSKRPDGGERMIESRAELFNTVPVDTITDIPWEPWPRFRADIAKMHLIMQPSFDETFDVVAADAAAEGVPCVCTPAIEWMPRSSWAEPWDPQSVMATGLALLHDPHAVTDARTHLSAYVKDGTRRWMDFILKEDDVSSLGSGNGTSHPQRVYPR